MGKLRDFLSIDSGFYEKVLQEPSAKSLLAANFLVVLFVVLDNWDLGFALVVFWWQNVIIGVFNVLKILTYPLGQDKISVVNNNKPSSAPQEISATAVKAVLAGFFAVHYGFFHFGYYSFLAHYFKTVNAGLVFLSVAVFCLQEAYSFVMIRRGGEKPEDIGRLFFFPYLRIFPMHVIIIVGMIILMVSSGLLGEQMGTMIGEKVVLVIFMVLKIKADIQMHLYEKDPTWLPGFMKKKLEAQAVSREFNK